MGTRFIHVDIKHGYNPIMICYARRLISQTCCASTVSTVGGCILSCRPLSSEDISLLMIKFLDGIEKYLSSGMIRGPTPQEPKIALEARPGDVLVPRPVVAPK